MEVWVGLVVLRIGREGARQMVAVVETLAVVGPAAVRRRLAGQEEDRIDLAAVVATAVEEAGIVAEEDTGRAEAHRTVAALEAPHIVAEAGVAHIAAAGVDIVEGSPVEEDIAGFAEEVDSNPAAVADIGLGVARSLAVGKGGKTFPQKCWSLSCLCEAVWNVL